MAKQKTKAKQASSKQAKQRGSAAKTPSGARNAGSVSASKADDGSAGDDSAGDDSAGNGSAGAQAAEPFSNAEAGVDAQAAEAKPSLSSAGKAAPRRRIAPVAGSVTGSEQKPEPVAQKAGRKRSETATSAGNGTAKPAKPTVQSGKASKLQASKAQSSKAKSETAPATAKAAVNPKQQESEVKPASTQLKPAAAEVSFADSPFAMEEGGTAVEFELTAAPPGKPKSGRGRPRVETTRVAAKANGSASGSAEAPVIAGAAVKSGKTAKAGTATKAPAKASVKAGSPKEAVAAKSSKAVQTSGAKAKKSVSKVNAVSAEADAVASVVEAEAASDVEAVVALEVGTLDAPDATEDWDEEPNEGAEIAALLGDETPAAEDADADTQALSEEEQQHLFLKGLLEALLFSSEKPMSLRELARGARLDKKRTTELLKELTKDCRRRGMNVVEIAGGYGFRSNPIYGSYVQKLLSLRPVKLSRAQLETIAVIAYRQPVTRPEVDEVRGVDSGQVIKGLLDRDLIKMLGKKDEVGRPMLYGTTDAFLELFNLESLKDLPSLKEFTELSDDSRDKYRDEMGEAAPGAQRDGEVAFESDPEANSDANSDASPAANPDAEESELLSTQSEQAEAEQLVAERLEAERLEANLDVQGTSKDDEAASAKLDVAEPLAAAAVNVSPQSGIDAAVELEQLNGSTPRSSDESEEWPPAQLARNLLSTEEEE